jgi:hypothetical protein
MFPETGLFMSKRLGVVAMMLLVIASFAVVSASEEQEHLVTSGGYIVEPSHGDDKGPIVIDTVYATITQGRTNWHTKVVSTFITTLNVDLNWGNPANSLRLKIYSPDGYTFGPYYDSFDGANDGRINLNIINNNGIARGTWYYEVYGYSVTGTQAYSI